MKDLAPLNIISIDIRELYVATALTAAKMCLGKPVFLATRDVTNPDPNPATANLIPHYLVPRSASISSAIAFFARWFGSSCSDARG